MKKQIKRKEGLLIRIMKGLFNKNLIKNKLYSILLMLIGYCSIYIIGDCTAFIFTLIIGLPLFFANKNVIN